MAITTNQVGPISVLDVSFKVAASNTITGYQVVKASGSNGGEVAIATANTDIPLGIAQVNPNEGVSYGEGKYIPVRIYGISKAVASQAITSGARVSVLGNAGGVDDTSGAGILVVGIALESARFNGDLINVILTPGACRHS